MGECVHCCCAFSQVGSTGLKGGDWWIQLEHPKPKGRSQCSFNNFQNLSAYGTHMIIQRLIAGLTQGEVESLCHRNRCKHHRVSVGVARRVSLDAHCPRSERPLSLKRTPVRLVAHLSYFLGLGLQVNTRACWTLVRISREEVSKVGKPKYTVRIHFSLPFFAKMWLRHQLGSTNRHVAGGVH